MANKRSELGCKQNNITPTRIVNYSVTNTAHQPREFRLSGKWYRWEPRGQNGDTITIAESIIQKPDFKRLEHYFAVKKKG